MIAGTATAFAMAAGAQSIQDADLRAGRVRTELPPGVGVANHPLNLTYTQPEPQGCLWNAQDAFSGCPGRAGLPNLPNGAPVWAGTLEGREACGGSTTRIGDSWIGCIAYDSSPYFALNNPGAQYWVISANDDPSFDQCNEGPPGLSHPVASANAQAPTPFKLDVLAVAGQPGKQFRVVLKMDDKNFFCSKTNQYMYSIPFLSVGAQNGRGNPGPVGYISRHGSAHGTIAFEAGLSSHQVFGCKPGTQSICSTAGSGVHAGLYALASWGGVPHLLFVDLFGEGILDDSADAPAESKWNWPVQDSFFYPGAEVLLFVAGTQLSTYCSIDLPRYTTDLAQRRYRIDFGAIFACAQRLGLLTQPMPDTDIALDGVHWYVEGVGTSGTLGFSFSHPETALFVTGFE
jgi:hypothetical protein